jgi:hypothetical protein
MEIMADNEKDVTPTQLQALKEFAAARYPDTPFYGHGEISSNRLNDEGMRGANLILQSRPPAFQFDWSNAPIPDPTTARPRSETTAPEPQTVGQAGGRDGIAQALQQGPTMPAWQSSINPAYRSPELISAVEREARSLGAPPEAIVGVAGVEGSNWNPQYMMRSQAGIFQIAPGDFRTAGGTLGGLTYDQYRRATPAQQVTAYADYIRSSPNAAYLDYASGDPALAAAILQGIQFSPQSEAFTNRLLAGDTSTPVRATQDQATELGNTSIDAMRTAFARRIAAFPQSQFLPGGR